METYKIVCISFHYRKNVRDNKNFLPLICTMAQPSSTFPLLSQQRLYLLMQFSVALSVVSGNPLLPRNSIGMFTAPAWTADPAVNITTATIIDTFRPRRSANGPFKRDPAQAAGINDY